jgi:hypothetical protein
MSNAIELVRSLQYRLHEIITELRALEFAHQCTSPRYRELVEQESQVRLELDSAWKVFNTTG